MTNLYIKLACFCGLLIAQACNVDIPMHIIPNTAAEVQTNAVRGLILRTVGEAAAPRFEVTVNKSMEFRSFKLQSLPNGNLAISGWDGTSAAKAFHYYLKYYLYRDISWTEPQAILPYDIELPPIQMTSSSQSGFIYYQNVCTWGYTFVWWNWSNWRQHIDWMAMMGISLTIAPVQEDVWYDVYQSMGLTQQEISEHFAGPAFAPWQRMGNMRGFGGPLSEKFRTLQRILQQLILKAQRDLGISVALPAFAGHAPRALARLYPNASWSNVSIWNGFDNAYSPIFLDTNDALFAEISLKFMRQISATFGSNHLYFADPFNEIAPRRLDPEYIAMTSRHIYETMQQGDDKAIWLLQGWMFMNDGYWTDELIKAFLTGVPQGKILALDLQSEQTPQYERTHSYYGHPFIWCMLHNFGGTLGMHGSVEAVNNWMGQARLMPNSSMVGAGITPEGIYQNYVVYALALERAWQQQDLNLPQWFDQFVHIRFGLRQKQPDLSEYMRILHKTVYSYYGIVKLHGKYVFNRRPSLSISAWHWYNASELHRAWPLLLAVNASIPATHFQAYEHDVVDLTRQCLQVLFDELYINMVSAFRLKQLSRFDNITKLMQNLLADMDTVLATNEYFMLGPWLEAAKSLSSSDDERQLLEFNARNQISMWGPNANILDYANKQWSGVVQHYFLPRWTLFFQMLNESLQENTKFNYNAYKAEVLRSIEAPFSYKTDHYELHAQGNALAVAGGIYAKWSQLMSSKQFLHDNRLKVKLRMHEFNNAF